MSNSSEYSEAASGNRTVTPPSEASSFSKTCDRLREYLKENGSLGDVGFGKSQVLPRSLSSMSLFPEGSAKADVSKVGDCRSVDTEPKKAQMTIFYGGQVMVFNDMPADKAMEVMRLATIATNQASGGILTKASPGLGVTPIESITKISRPVLGEIPIARKQSLARFLEKRKERIMSHSPYSNSTKGAISASMPSDKSWLGLAGS